jgi:hypothetical protein
MIFEDCMGCKCGFTYMPAMPGQSWSTNSSETRAEQTSLQGGQDSCRDTGSVILLAPLASRRACCLRALNRPPPHLPQLSHTPLTHSTTCLGCCPACSKQHPISSARSEHTTYNGIRAALRPVPTPRTSMSGLSGSRRGICLSLATMMVTTRSSSFVVFTTSTANRPALRKGQAGVHQCRTIQPTATQSPC